MWDLARRAGLDLNSPYAYVMWADHFGATSVVASRDDGDSGAELLGYVTGFLLPDEPTTLFIWQIAVDDQARGRGLGGAMLDELVERTGATALEATVTPDNAASAALFRGLAGRQGSVAMEEEAYPARLFPGDHEAEIRFRILIAPP